MKKDSILITGSSGFIGQYLVSKLRTSFYTIGIDIESIQNDQCDHFYELDIRNSKKIKEIFKRHKVNYVIHSAAAKDLLWCENNKKKAYDINFTSSIKLHNLSNKNNAKFIYISSDQVFDGKSKNSKENSNKNPLNYYGKLKDKVERKIIGSKRTAICRTAMVFGNIPMNQKKIFGKIKNKNSLKVQGFIIQHLIYKLSNNQKFILPQDEYCNPTSNMLLSKQIKSVIEKDLSGILHLCGGERISRYDFGKKIAKIYNLNADLIVPLKVNNPLRPKDVSMSFSDTQKKIGVSFSKVNDMIRQIKKENGNGSIRYIGTNEYGKAGKCS